MNKDGKSLETAGDASKRKDLVVDKEKLEQAVKKLDELQNEIEDKKYLIGDAKYASMLLEWVTVNVSWKYSQAIAVTKLYDTMYEAMNDIKSGKSNGKLYLKAVELKAFNILFQDIKGTGYQQAKRYKDIIMPIVDVLSKNVKNDEDLISRQQFIISSIEQGIEPDEKVIMEGLN